MDLTTNGNPHISDNASPAAETPTSEPQATVGARRGADEQVRAIARAVDRNARKTTELDGQVRRLATDVARLVALVTTPPPTGPAATPVGRPAPGPAEQDPGEPSPEVGEADVEHGDGDETGPPPVRSWLLATDPELAVADLADLVEWLDRVYLRYPQTELGGCWLWHPHVIEELWWLRRAHADAYDPETGSWLRVGDWHDRQRPAVARRVREAIGKCDLSLHAPGRVQGHAPVVAPLVAHAARIAVEWATTSTRPVPTPTQLAEAGDYAQALHRRGR